ncbi:MAG TPA: RNA-binding transcriptional accessory protein [Candidatus Coproplasma avicola]|uniref:RNA-binding transcriptional accessory protein n=1 Tax=Candidatus Coproplasma avicola TaxID=2840744 RepID=A0A9D1E6T8_9FIRM|nr:RNA-binding transcriptional accessory protein [Candidatus Coproplasma avicola]
MEILEQLTTEFNLRPDHAKNVVDLLDEGNTIPFIARYRKEMTGAIDDQVLRKFADRYEYLLNLKKRKEEVAKAITEQGKMTEEIQTAIDGCATLTEIEDVYRPFKQKKKTRASVAIEKGLKPLAEFILEQNGDPYAEAEKYIDAEKGVEDVAAAIAGARDIIAEIISDNAELRKKLRTLFENHGEIQVKMVEDDEKGTYAMYADYAELVPEIKNHRVLAINRGEKEGCLKVKLYFNPDLAKRVCTAKYVHSKGACADIITEAADDGYDRLIEPSIEREVRAILTDRASEQAIKMFEVNLRPLLLQPPVKGKVTLGLDPGYRTGCKVAVVDPTGKVLATSVIYPVPPHNKTEESKKIIKDLIAKCDVNVIAIGNGTASKETEIFVAELLKEIDADVSYAVVNEAGASVYSASPLAVEEFPDYDLTLRSAISIARRLQDPLAELIKIDPKSIGVGQYQHDMDKKRLDSVLGGVLEDCVNSVGVDLNTASVSLLKFVAGLNAGIAKNIVAYREENGAFTERKQLLKVSKLGAKAFEQCAGFLRVPGGSNIFDNTAVHPESYSKAEKLLSLFGYTTDDVRNNNLSDLPAKVKEFGEDKAAEYCELDKATMNDIISELIKPGRDVRDSLPAPKLRRDIMGIEDLAVGMEVEGTVRNVIDFGAFIDIGVHQDGLVHVSEISDKYIRHPSDVLKVGQRVKAVIINLDVKKQRIGLSIKQVKKQAN